MSSLNRVTIANVSRAIKAAHGQGLEVVSTEIKPDGTIRLTHSEAAASTDPWDKWKAGRNAN